MQAGDFPPDQHFIVEHMIQDVRVFQHFIERRLDVFLVAVALNGQDVYKRQARNFSTFLEESERTSDNDREKRS